MTSMYISLLRTDDLPRILEKFEWPYFSTDHPIQFMFGSRVGFSRSADRMALLPVAANPRRRPAAVFENFEWPYL